MGKAKVDPAREVDPARYVKNRSRKKFTVAVFQEEEHYNYLYSGMSTRWRLDASASYLVSEEAPQKIYDYNPHAILIVILRHPVRRAWSHYLMCLSVGRTSRSLREVVQMELESPLNSSEPFLIRASSYRDGLGRYRSIFPAENIVEIRFEELVANPSSTLAPLMKKLSIDPDGIDLGQANSYTRASSRVTKFPAINRWATQIGLRGMFRSAMPYAIRKRMLSLLYPLAGDLSIPEADLALLETALAEEIAHYEDTLVNTRSHQG